MKKIRWYIPNVLLTFLLVFMILATELTLFARTQVLNVDTFRTVAEEQELADKAYLSLESHFKTRANSTGIPAEVFTDVMNREELHAAILSSVAQAFDYLNGKTDTYEFTMDFKGLEASVNSFFEEYAAENNYKKDEAYQKKVDSVIESAESQILFVADTFKFSTMYSKGWLKTAKTYVSYLNLASTACIVAVVLVILLLILCNLKQIGHFFYWSGLASLIASLLLLTPCVYIKATDYFAGFALKDPQIFAAVVGFLDLLTTRALTMAIVTLITAVIFLIAFGFICGLRWEDEEVEEKLAAKPKMVKQETKKAESTAEEAAEPITDTAETPVEETPAEVTTDEETSETETAAEETPDEETSETENAVEEISETDTAQPETDDAESENTEETAK